MTALMRDKVSVAIIMASCWILSPTELRAQNSQGLSGEVAELREQLNVHRRLIEEQARLLAEQQEQIKVLREFNSVDLATIRGEGYQPESPGSTVPQATDTADPNRIRSEQFAERSLDPVGMAPPDAELRTDVQAIPREQGVLTPRGQLVIEPAIEYTRSSNNRLVFRGFELIPGIQVGLIEATDADRDTLVGSGSFRYGLTNRLEVDGRVSYIYRNDRIEVAQQRDEGIVRSIRLSENDIGDIEFGMRYQLNDAKPLQPIWIANLRIKSDSGIGPFDIEYDEFGVATGLTTGSGFWAIQPGINFLLPSDPAVIYGGVSYIYQMDKDIDKEISGAFIGNVDPGDAVSANIGFGFSLNPRFSFSMGYRHLYIFPTRSEIADTVQRSNSLQIGSLAFGMSYLATRRQVLNLGFEFGVTEDAPDVSITLRVPFAF